MELLGVHYMRLVLNASTVQECPVGESYGAPRARFPTSNSPSLSLSLLKPKGLIANCVHCPATLLNGERRHPPRNAMSRADNTGIEL